MKLLSSSIALFYLTQQGNAFAPSITTPQSSLSSTSLYASTLEGWKIDGVLKPTNNFILVKTAGIQDKTEGGILLAKGAKIKKTEGTVISAGPGNYHQDTGIPYPMPVTPGDGVVYGQYDGLEVNIDGDVHSLIRDSDVLIKFREGGEGEDEGLTLDGVETINDGVLVRVETKETETSTGLLLGVGGDENGRPSTGVVVKVGPGRMKADGELMPMGVEEGDEVKFRDFAGNEVKIGKEEYSLVTMPDILAKF